MLKMSIFIYLEKYFEYAMSSRGDPTRGGPPDWRLGGGQTNLRLKKKKKTSTLRNVKQDLELERIL
jgi:hypothetical protein